MKVFTIKVYTRQGERDLYTVDAENFSALSAEIKSGLESKLITLNESGDGSEIIIRSDDIHKVEIPRYGRNK